MRGGSLAARSDGRISVSQIDIVRSREAQNIEQGVIQAIGVFGDAQLNSNLLGRRGSNFLVESNENRVNRILRCIHQVLSPPGHTRVIAHRTCQSAEGLRRRTIIGVVDRPTLFGMSNQGEGLKGRTGSHDVLRRTILLALEVVLAAVFGNDFTGSGIQ